MARRQCGGGSGRSFRPWPPHHQIADFARSAPSTARPAIKSFIFIRNINLILSGSRGFILAHLLGPAGYGVLGSLIALQQMLSYAALGMREGVLISLSGAGHESAHRRVYSSAIVFAAAVGLTLPAGMLVYSLAVRASVDVNYMLVSAIGGMSVVNEVLININRHEGNFARVSVCELSYNLVILVLIFLSQKLIGVTLALTWMLIGVTLSVSIYALRLKLFSLSEVSFRMMKELVSLGFFPSVLSAVLIIINLGFILVAQRHLPEVELGQFVFANNIATMILVSLNAFAWAMTSRSMRALAGPAVEYERSRSVVRTDLYLRIGVVGALIAALTISVGLPLVTESYSGAGKYVLLFVAIQSFQLTTFTESNFLMMRNKIPVLIGIYGAANAVNYALIELLANFQPFYTTMIFAIVCICLATMGVMLYARSIGLTGFSLRTKYSSTLSIVAAVVLFYNFGIFVPLIFLSVFLCFMFLSNRKDIRFSLA